MASDLKAVFHPDGPFWATPVDFAAADTHFLTSLLGLYCGVPLTQRGGLPPPFPDRVTLFRGPLLRTCRTEAELRAQVRHTVLHELAHFFGISDDRLRELGAY